MKPRIPYHRPPFEDALNAWKTLLAQKGLSTKLVWVFDENLCFEKDAAAPNGFRLGFQTAFTPPPAAAESIAYNHFCECDALLVFYRLGAWQDASVCLLLCDEWLDRRAEADGYLLRGDWLIAFRPGTSEPIPEITDLARWKSRMLRNRPLHDLDFCMTLRAVHETLAHGRPLTAYEHYALKLLDTWRRMLGRS